MKGADLESTAVRERPIVMSGPMVKAILSGRKVQTRRVVRGPDGLRVCRCGYTRTGWAFELADGACTCKPARGPAGDVGDRLWVREAWAPYPNMGGGVWFKAGVPVYEAGRRTGGWESYDRLMGLPIPDDIRWRSPLVMPNWASRITLEIVGVRVERLQAISEADAIAEGLRPVVGPCGDHFWTSGSGEFIDPVAAFVSLWDSINGKKAGRDWASNPFVWCIAFRKINP